MVTGRAPPRKAAPPRRTRVVRVLIQCVEVSVPRQPGGHHHQGLADVGELLQGREPAEWGQRPGAAQRGELGPGGRGMRAHARAAWGMHSAGAGHGGCTPTSCLSWSRRKRMWKEVAKPSTSRPKKTRYHLTSCSTCGARKGQRTFAAASRWGQDGRVTANIIHEVGPCHPARPVSQTQRLLLQRVGAATPTSFTSSRKAKRVARKTREKYCSLPGAPGAGWDPGRRQAGC